MKKNFVLFVLLAEFILLPFSVSAKKVKDAPKEAVSGDITVKDDFKKIDESLDNYNFEFDENDFKYVIIKQATKMIIWAEKPVSNETDFLAALKIANKDKSLKDSYFENPTFITGEGTFDLTKVAKQFGVYELIIDGNTVTLNCDASKISHANYGTYIDRGYEEEIPPVEYVYTWEKVESVKHDTAVGLGRENNNYEVTTNGNWFLGQHLVFADGETEKVLDIQAGKKGALVGTVTLTRNGDEYTITYEANDILPEPDPEKYPIGTEIEITELSDAKYKVSDTQIVIGNAGKDLTPITKAPTFTNDNDFHFHIHLSADKVKYVLVATPVENN